MRKDVHEAMTTTFTATWVVALFFAVPSVIGGYLISGSGGIVVIGGGIIVSIISAFLSAIAHFWYLTRQRMNFNQTVLIIGIYALILAVMIPILWTLLFIHCMGFPIVFFGIIALPAALAACFTKMIYPRFAVPM